MSSVITEYAPSETGQDVDIFSLVAKGGRNPEDPARWHAMLLSYFDDSSDGKHRYYFAVGGLVGPESQWSDFHAPWALATKNLKEPFRSTECECQEGQFKGWDKSDCDALMDRLVSIVLDQRIHGYASVVPIATYKSVFPNCDEYDPYYLAIRHSIINMGELGHKEQRLRGTGGMKCWFEDSTATRGKTRLIYEALRDLESWKASVSLAPNAQFEPKTLRPLQAADLIAREAYKHFINLGRRKTRIPVDRLKHLLNFHLWSRPSLEFLRDNGGPEDINLLTSWESSIPKPPQFDRYWGDDFPTR